MRALLRNLILLSKKVVNVILNQPWTKGNSWLVKADITDLIFNVKQAQYRDTYAQENLSVGIADLIFDAPQIYYKNRYTKEHLTPGISDIKFIATKV